MSLENLFKSVLGDNSEKNEKVLKNDEIIGIIRDRGLEDSEVLSLVSNYSMDSRKKFEKQNPETAEIENTLHMADIYFDSGYTDLALDNIENARQTAKESGNDEMIQKIDEQKNLMIETLRK